MKHIILLICFLIIGSDLAAQETFDPVEGAKIIQCDHERSTMRPVVRYMLNQDLKRCRSNIDCKLKAFTRAGMSHMFAEREILQ